MAGKVNKFYLRFNDSLFASGSSSIPRPLDPYLGGDIIIIPIMDNDQFYTYGVYNVDEVFTGDVGKAPLFTNLTRSMFTDETESIQNTTVFFNPTRTGTNYQGQVVWGDNQNPWASTNSFYSDFIMIPEDASMFFVILAIMKKNLATFT